jgi:AraC family ethanolamine operon transcriptional activator
MQIKRYKDFYCFLRDIKFLKFGGMVASLKTPEWIIHSLVVGELELQYGWSGGASIINGEFNGDGNLVHIPLNGSCKVNGKSMLSDSVLVCVPDIEYIISFNDVHDWLNLFIPIKIINLILQKNRISETNQPSGVVHVGNDAVLKFKKVLQETISLAKKTNGKPRGLTSNGKVEKEILAIYEYITLKPPVIKQIGVGRRIIDRTQIMMLIKNKLQSEQLDSIFVEDLAVAANVSGRTFRKICIDYFGISPLRYLIIYKMHAARKVLQDSNHSNNTVSNIATKFGFWHFGRFASGYRNLFGERPLDTLNNGHKKTKRP